MGKILVVDDEARVRAAFAELLTGAGHEVQTADCGERALELLEGEAPDLVIMDVYMPGMDGLEVFRRVKEGHPRLPVIITTGRGSTELAISAAKLGAFDYQPKPFDPGEMLALVDRALESVRLMRGNAVSSGESRESGRTGMIGQSAVMQEIYKAIGRVAPTDATALIRGESGTGKEMVAQALYKHSLRAEQPLVVVNCVAIPESLLESELFGHERGAFTGAHGRRIGKFEQANGGTIFLDEIGDIPLGTQAKILRVLQDKTIERLGGNETLQVDVRLLAATNRNLEEAIAAGAFREDLYHRLKVVTISIPPLRDRKEDLPKLAAYFLDRFSKELRLDKPVLTGEALEMLQAYPWPGNVRELEHCIHRAMIFTQGYPIQAQDIQAALGQSGRKALGPVGSSSDSRLLDVVKEHLRFSAGSRALTELLERVERLLLVEALRQTRGNQTYAASLLGVPRPTLHAKLRKHKVQPHP
jgi:nitrogen regulation protein NR(I)